MRFLSGPDAANPAPNTVPNLFDELSDLVRQRSEDGTRLIVDDSAYSELDQAIASRMQRLGEDGALLRSFAASVVDRRSIPKLQGAQSFFVFDSQYLTARINLWFAEDHRVGNVDSYRRYLSVGELHNHDFSFYTINLTGPGYKTHFYRDLEFRDDLEIGDSPKLEDMGVHSLNESKVLFVEAFKDYHLQMWPESFSVTLNVIPKMAEIGCAVQYILDDENLTVKTVADSSR